MRREKKRTIALGEKTSLIVNVILIMVSLLEVDKKVIWGYFSSKITKTVQAKLSYMGLFFLKNLSTIWILVHTQIYVLCTS